MAATTAAAPIQIAEPSKYLKITRKLMDSFIIRSPSSSSTKPTDLPVHVKTFSQLLSSPGYCNLGKAPFYSLLDLYPRLYSDELKPQNRVQSGLRNLFKCDVYHHGCHFSAPTVATFRQHLVEEHPAQQLYCLYCSIKDSHDSEGRCLSVNEHVTFSQPEQLAEHIKVEHSHLNYQCNLCLYRALSPEHVFLHQALEHVDEFEQSLHRAIRDKLDETGDISPLESALLAQTHDPSEGKSDDETEVEDNGGADESVSSASKQRTDSRAKILDCGDFSLDGDDRRAVAAYFAKHMFDFESRLPPSKLKEVLDSAHSSSFPCAYCPLTSDGLTGGKRNYFHHHALAHADLPFLAYDLALVRQARGLEPLGAAEPFNELDELDLDSIDEDYARQLITDFRETLDNDSQIPTYSAALMEDAFKYYQNLDWNSDNFVESTTDDDESNISQGVKRKRNDQELEDDNEEEEEGEEKEAEDEVDSAVTTTEEPAPKRRRLLYDLRLPSISQTFLRRTKRVASVVATAAMALGFYHLTHFLPESVQTYLN